MYYVLKPGRNSRIEEINLYQVHETRIDLSLDKVHVYLVVYEEHYFRSKTNPKYLSWLHHIGITFLTLDLVDMMIWYEMYESSDIYQGPGVLRSDMLNRIEYTGVKSPQYLQPPRFLVLHTYPILIQNLPFSKPSF